MVPSSSSTTGSTPSTLQFLCVLPAMPILGVRLVCFWIRDYWYLYQVLYHSWLYVAAYVLPYGMHLCQLLRMDY